MKSLTELLEGRKLEAPAPAAAPTPPPAQAAASKEAPKIETPPGLPQEYIDINLLNQPLPAIADMATIAEEQRAKPLNARLVPGGESLCNATDIPYSPGRESAVVKDRIAQGPHAFVSRAQREKFEKDFDEEKSQVTKPGQVGQKVAHPDTLKPGTHITGESRVYRPG